MSKMRDRSAAERTAVERWENEGGRAFAVEAVVPQQPDRPSETMESPRAGDQVTADCGIIELHLRELSQFFDSLDPSPFHEKDLDRDAEEYIIESAQELHAKAPCALVLHLDQPAGPPDEARVVEDAIRVHFARRARILRQRLRQLIRRGVISFVIGLVFLAAVFTIAQIVMQMMGERPLATLLREGLLIIGWVAMWRPLEIFLYDWWPILGARRLHDRLSRISVRIVYQGTGAAEATDARSDRTFPKESRSEPNQRSTP